MRRDATALLIVTMLSACAAGMASAGDGGGRVVTGGPVDRAVVVGSPPAGETTLVVMQFTTENTDFGTGDNPQKEKAQQVARDMKAAAPITLAQTLVNHVEGKKAFASVSLGDAGAAPTSGLTLRGEFTLLNPGSRGKRFWVGMGAGRSRVCVKGEVVDAEGKVLLTFDHCRSGTGAWSLAGGRPEGMMATDIAATAERIAELLSQWKNGAWGK